MLGGMEATGQGGAAWTLAPACVQGLKLKRVYACGVSAPGAPLSSRMRCSGRAGAPAPTAAPAALAGLPAAPLPAAPNTHASQPFSHLRAQARGARRGRGGALRRMRCAFQQCTTRRLGTPVDPVPQDSTKQCWTTACVRSAQVWDRACTAHARSFGCMRYAYAAPVQLSTLHDASAAQVSQHGAAANARRMRDTAWCAGGRRARA